MLPPGNQLHPVNCFMYPAVSMCNSMNIDFFDILSKLFQTYNCLQHHAFIALCLAVLL